MRSRHARRGLAGGAMALMLVAGGVAPAAATGMFGEQQVLGSGELRDGFGAALAVDGPLLAVGAPETGIVWIYRQSGGTWSLEQKVRGAGRCGAAVAVEGNTVAVGCPDAGFRGEGSGAVFVYARTTDGWVQQQRLLGGADFDRFGSALSLSGGTLVVGAPYHPRRASIPLNRWGEGKVQVFTRNLGVWSQRKQIEGPFAGSHFGSAVAVSGDALAATATSGTYVYTGSGSSWTLREGLPGGLYGLGMDGNVLAFGTVVPRPGALQNAVYAYARSGTRWVLVQIIEGFKDTDDFGAAVAVHDTMLVVGAPGIDKAYVFHHVAGEWRLEEMLKGGDGFGSAAAFTEGTIVVGGAPLPVGAVKVFRRGMCAGRWATHTGTAGDDLILGTSGADVIVGLGGDDEIRGGDGADLICAGPGNDLVSGHGGPDEIRGEDGDDRIIGGLGADLLLGGPGADRLLGGPADDTLDGGAGDDVLAGGGGPDRLVGGGGADVLRGGAGNDEIVGVDGADVLSGGAGDDALYGNRGADLLRGGPDRDTLSGGPDDDRLFGDEGNDRLDGNTGKDTLNGGDGRDACVNGVPVECEV